MLEGEILEDRPPGLLAPQAGLIIKNLGPVILVEQEMRFQVIRLKGNRRPQGRGCLASAQACEQVTGIVNISARTSLRKVEIGFRQVQVGRWAFGISGNSPPGRPDRQERRSGPQFIRIWAVHYLKDVPPTYTDQTS